MAKHSEIFKRDVVLSLKLLREKGIIRMKDKDKTEIKNMRQLCYFFGISTQSVYAWEKLFSHLKTEINDDSVEIIPLRVVCVSESFCKAYQEVSENNENCNMLGKCNDFEDLDDYGEVMFINDGLDSQESESDFDDINYKKETRIAKKSEVGFFVPGDDKKIVQDKKEKAIFNQRYYGWFAGMLGIKNYSNMLVPQLKVAIGNELIRQSGLVDMKKASKKLKKNGDNL